MNKPSVSSWVSFLLLLFLLTHNNNKVYGQHFVQGIVKEEATAKPVQRASVFLSNTKIGIITEADGSYKLMMPQGDFDMVISCIGFETKLITLQNVSSDTIINITLQPKVAELQEVIVRAYDKDGWKKWGNLFLDLFVGTSDFARQCTIENKSMIHFVNKKSADLLFAYADEPLQITNKALGYRLQYQLVNFKYDLRSNISYYEGYPLFIEMEGDAKQKKRWNNNRMEAYQGSEMQFLRALCKNRVRQEGFDVKGIWKPTDDEIKNIRRRIGLDEIPKDSLTYYLRVLAASRENGIVIDTPLTGKHVTYSGDSNTVVLLFQGSLNVLYHRKTVPEDYNRQAAPEDKDVIMSQISLLNPDMPVSVQSSGNFYPALNLFATGYWAWSEKIGRLLPLDYTLPTSSSSNSFEHDNLKTENL